MAVRKTTIMKNRRIWINDLRTSKLKRCTGQMVQTKDGELYDPKTNPAIRVCALGMAYVRFGEGYKNKLGLSTWKFNETNLIKYQGDIMELNDSKNWSFKKIATYIEKNWL